MRRQIEQQKFTKDGGLAKSIYRQNGSGYTQAGPLTVIVGPPNAEGAGPWIQAEATATIGTSETATGSVPNTITEITITNPGTGYIKPPLLTIPAPAESLGVRANAVALTDG